MNRQSAAFFLTFVVTAVLVGGFVYVGAPLYALLAGLAGLLLHWVLSNRLAHGGDRDGEVADASYFFGFLMTLVFLAVGIYRIGMPSTPGAAAGDTVNVLGFLVDLSAGLMLTIAGLVIRQVRTLAHSANALESAGSDTSLGSDASLDAGATSDTGVAQARPTPAAQLLEAQRELTQSLKEAADLWRARPEHEVREQLRESRSVAHDAAQNLERSVASASARIAESVGRLDDATSDATQAMTRAASSVGSSMAEVAQRMEVEIEHALDSVRGSVTQTLRRMDTEITSALEAIRQQRIAADAALTAARAAGDEMMAEARTHQEQQLELWRANLDQARAALAQAHDSLDDEYRRGLSGFAASGAAFAELASAAASQVQSLPNPAERLAGLWDGVRQLEADLSDAIAGSVEQLNDLSSRSAELRESLARLAGSADSTATRIGTGTDRLSGSLQRELQQMNDIIDSYVALLEKTRTSLKVSA